MKYADDSLEWHDENELVRKLDVVEAVLNLADTIDDVVDVIMSVPNTDAPYIDIETGKEAFVNELIGYIFAYPDDDYMTMECLCRKLHKHGLIERKDGEWTCNFIEKADTPQTD